MKNTIKVERAKMDISQRELARRIGVTPGTINSIETRRFMPSVFLAFRIATFFKVKVDDIFCLEEGEDETIFFE